MSLVSSSDVGAGAGAAAGADAAGAAGAAAGAASGTPSAAAGASADAGAGAGAGAGAPKNDSRTQVASGPCYMASLPNPNRQLLGKTSWSLLAWMELEAIGD